MPGAPACQRAPGRRHGPRSPPQHATPGPRTTGRRTQSWAMTSMHDAQVRARVNTRLSARAKRAQHHNAQPATRKTRASRAGSGQRPAHRSHHNTDPQTGDAGGQHGCIACPTPRNAGITGESRPGHGRTRARAPCRVTRWCDSQAHWPRTKRNGPGGNPPGPPQRLRRAYGYATESRRPSARWTVASSRLPRRAGPGSTCQPYPSRRRSAAFHR